MNLYQKSVNATVEICAQAIKSLNIMAKSKRNTNKYHFKVGNKVVHGGITDRELSDREVEHRASGNITKENGKSYKWSDGHIVKVGNKTTRDKGLGWERDNGFGANQE